MRSIPFRLPLAIFFGSATLLAQVSGRLAGSVLDASNKPVAAAALRLYLPGGSEAVASTRSLNDGYFVFSNLRPAYYDLVVEAPGKAKETIRGLKVDPARETPLAPVRMRQAEFSQSASVLNPQQQAAPQTGFATTTLGDSFRLGLGSNAELLEISEQERGTNVRNAEVATTMTPDQVRGLPVLDRDPVALLGVQAGVNIVGVFGYGISSQLITVVNGQRSSFGSMSLDGINMQEQYDRTNPLGSEFNRLYLDQLSEFTVITSNANSTLSGGSAQVVMVSPSGTNRMHGAGYYYGRNQALAANNWLANAHALPLTDFIQHQFGGSFSGPIRKNKLLFYGNYEGFRLRESPTVVRYLPTADIRTGIFTYTDAVGRVNKLDLMQASGLSIHPQIQKLLDSLPPASKIDPTRDGDGPIGQILNTGRYAFPLRDNLNRDSALARADWIASERHTVSFTFNWSHDLRDDPGFYTEGYGPAPSTSGNNPRILVSASWRWSPTPQFTNEIRGGVHLHSVELVNNANLTSGVLQLPSDPTFAGYPLFTNPVNPSQSERRNERTFVLQDNASWTRGKHSLQFGYQMQLVRSRISDDFTVFPTYYLGFDYGYLTAMNLPGASADTVARANLWASTLAGIVNYVSGYTTLTSASPAYSNNAPETRNYLFPQFAGYAFDSWRIHPRLNLTLGLRYDLFLSASEQNGLALQPVAGNVNPVQAMLSNASLDVTAGRSWYPANKRNFAPNIGLAWDITGNGKTVLRAGWGIYYVNDEIVRAAATTLNYNPGGILPYAADYSQDTVFLSPSLIPPPLNLKPPFTLKDASAAGILGLVATIDPGLKTPYVQQWNIGVQREFKGFILEARYVGNQGVQLLRSIDFNQVQTTEPTYFSDFLRAYNNGKLAYAATGIFNPAYSSNIAGSQQLGIMNRLRLDNPTVQNAIRNGEAGEIAAIFGFKGIAPLVPSSLIPEGATMLMNLGRSSYNGLQIEATRRLKNGLFVQANYAFARSLANTRGVSGDRYEAPVDIHNLRIERAPTPFDLRHAVKALVLWEVPAARWLGANSGVAKRLSEGWTLSGSLTAQSGNPFSIVSGTGSLNISGSLSQISSRSDNNTAYSPLNYNQLKQLIDFHYSAYGFSIIRASATSVLGTGAVPAADKPFAGEAFFNPQPGTTGNLQQRMFAGPMQYTINLALIKAIRIKGSHALEFRAEARNVTNHPNFSIVDQNINSISFGYAGATIGDNERQIQFGVYYRF